MRIVAWLGQVILWIRLGWPFAVGVWSILRDGKFTVVEATVAVESMWPKDAAGDPKVIELPFMTKLTTER